MKFEQVCQSLYSYLIQNRVVRSILPYAGFIMFLCAGLQLLGSFVSLGSFAYTGSYLGFLFMMLLVLSLCSFKLAAIGWGIRSLQYLYYVLRAMLKDHYMNWTAIIYLLVYVCFAYQCYKKSLQVNE